jgi:hypothetical protein
MVVNAVISSKKKCSDPLRKALINDAYRLTLSLGHVMSCICDVKGQVSKLWCRRPLFRPRWLLVSSFRDLSTPTWRKAPRTSSFVSSVSGSWFIRRKVPEMSAGS